MPVNAHYSNVADNKFQDFVGDACSVLSSSAEGDELAPFDAETNAELIGLYDAAEA